MKNYQTTVSFSEISEQYTKAKRSIGICHQHNVPKILITGEKALQLINHYSVSKVDEKIANNFYALLLKGKKIISEVLVLRLSVYRFLVIPQDYHQTFKLFKRIKRRFPITTVTEATDAYGLFSFHGDNALAFFQDIDYKYIFKTTHQDYTYYQLLSPIKDEESTLRHFINLNFTPISLEAEKIFLYNNNVVLNLKTIPRSYRLSICHELYPFENIHLKTKDVKVVKYELEGNYLVTNKHFIYNYLGKKAGIIHCIYRIPNKNNPFIIAFVKRPKMKKVSLIKIGKTDALVKQVINY